MERLLAQSERIRQACELVQGFGQLVRERQRANLRTWTAQVEASGLTRLQQFARGLHHDWEAVVAGLSLPWSNGPVGGQVYRLKLIKRQMYGRAHLPLLRARVLPLG